MGLLPRAMSSTSGPPTGSRASPQTPLLVSRRLSGGLVDGDSSNAGFDGRELQPDKAAALRPSSAGGGLIRVSNPLGAIGRTAARGLIAAYEKANPDARENIHRTVRGLVGNEFTDKEIDTIVDEMAVAADGDGRTLMDYGNRSGLKMTPEERAAFGRVIGRMRRTPLNDRARKAYERAIHDGRL